MRLERELPMSPEQVKWNIHNSCHCIVSPFRLTQLSFWPPKEYGLFCAMIGDCIFFSIHNKKEWGFRAPRRHLRICLNGKHDRCSLHGSLKLSDFITYLLVVLGFCIALGMAMHSTHFAYYIIAIIGYMVGWFLQCLVGILAFREDEKLLISEVNNLLDRIAESKTEQREESLSDSDVDEWQQ